MSKRRSFFVYWLPVLIWMTVIFSASSDKLSSQHSSRIIAPVLFWLFPHIQEKTVWKVVTVVRKCAHLTEFAVLSILLWRAFRKPQKHDAHLWSWRAVWLSLLISALYAGSDELHQMFVPKRTAMFTDVLIDICGAAAGLAFVCLVERCWKKNRETSAAPVSESPAA